MPSALVVTTCVAAEIYLLLPNFVSALTLSETMVLSAATFKLLPAVKSVFIFTFALLLKSVTLTATVIAEASGALIDVLEVKSLSALAFTLKSLPALTSLPVPLISTDALFSAPATVTPTTNWLAILPFKLILLSASTFISASASMLISSPALMLPSTVTLALLSTPVYTTAVAGTLAPVNPPAALNFKPVVEAAEAARVSALASISTLPFSLSTFAPEATLTLASVSKTEYATSPVSGVPELIPTLKAFAKPPVLST